MLIPIHAVFIYEIPQNHKHAGMKPMTRSQEVTECDTGARRGKIHLIVKKFKITWKYHQFEL